MLVFASLDKSLEVLGCKNFGLLHFFSTNFEKLGFITVINYLNVTFHVHSNSQNLRRCSSRCFSSKVVRYLSSYSTLLDKNTINSGFQIFKKVSQSTDSPMRFKFLQMLIFLPFVSSQHRHIYRKNLYQQCFSNGDILEKILLN